MIPCDVLDTSGAQCLMDRGGLSAALGGLRLGPGDPNPESRTLCGDSAMYPYVYSYFV